MFLFLSRIVVCSVLSVFLFFFSSLFKYERNEPRCTGAQGTERARRERTFREIRSVILLFILSSLSVALFIDDLVEAIESE